MSTPPPAHDIATAVMQGAQVLGHRPAVSVLLPAGRQEQSGVSLAQWTAKGAHLLQFDHELAPGDVVGLGDHWSWTTAAVALATWWVGGTVALGTTGDTRTTVGPVPTDTTATPEYLLGDGIDGAPAPDATTGPSWTHEAQPMPDQPPAPLAEGDLVAVRHAGRLYTQQQLLAIAAARGPGVIGIEVGPAPNAPVTPDAPVAPDTDTGADTLERIDVVEALALVALRPLLTGTATVVIRDVARAQADGDRVRTWLRVTQPA